jgi:hypothetical protein
MEAAAGVSTESMDCGWQAGEHAAALHMLAIVQMTETARLELTPGARRLAADVYSGCVQRITAG